MSINWEKVNEYQDIIYEKAEGIAKVTINRPEVRNAFTPVTVQEMYNAFSDAREDQNIGVVLLTGAGPPRTASTLSAPAVIKRSAEKPDTSVTTGFHA